MFNDPQKAVIKSHNNEQKFGNIWGLSAQNNSLSILPKH